MELRALEGTERTGMELGALGGTERTGMELGALGGTVMGLGQKWECWDGLLGALGWHWAALPVDSG